MEGAILQGARGELYVYLFDEISLSPAEEGEEGIGQIALRALHSKVSPAAVVVVAFDPTAADQLLQVVPQVLPFQYTVFSSSACSDFCLHSGLVKA